MSTSLPKTEAMPCPVMTTLFLSETVAAAMMATPAAHHELDAIARNAGLTPLDYATVILRALCADSSVDHFTVID